MNSVIEPQFQGFVLRWLSEIASEEGLLFEFEQEFPIRTGEGAAPLKADIVIFKREGARDAEGTVVRKPACILELKRPSFNGYSLSLTENAMRKASLLGAPFFATWNVREFVLWETFKEGTPLLERRRLHRDVVSVKRMSEVRRNDVQAKIKDFLRRFLREFHEIYERRRLPALPLDRIFIERLKSAVNTFYIPLSEHIQRIASSDAAFRERLRAWFKEQTWIFTGKEEDFDRVSRLCILILVAKLLFYNFLRSVAKGFKLPEIQIPAGSSILSVLNEYFERCPVGIFKREFLDDLPFPADKDFSEQFGEFVREIERYDLSKIEYDVLGSIFENLIPDEERHKFGQYFTPSSVVDFMLSFCVKSGNERILDPACGAGTFLTRAYALKRLKGKKRHEEILQELKGVDISEFACYLTKMNLAIKNVFAAFNADIQHDDFFNVLPPSASAELFDVVITNPPYTRQEEIEDIFPKGYKERLRKIAREEAGIDAGKRMSIYGYFFIHGAKFLKEGGRMALITSNSWLDVDYGRYIQEFLLKNFKIIAIIESKVERWFSAADVNTCITVLEKCSSSEERMRNFVRFVQLKKPLRELLRVSVREGESEARHWKNAEMLASQIERYTSYEENESMRIFVVEQGKLWEEGFDADAEKYVGSKWGKYLRAPSIFFKILEKGKDLFVPLKAVAEVRFGIKTGANEFFYLTEEQIKAFGIEREFWMHPLRKCEEPPVAEDVWKDKGGEYFKNSQYAEDFSLEDVLRSDGFVYWIPNYVIKSLRECKSIVINPKDLKFRVLLIHKDKEDLRETNVLKYIEWGEEKPREFHKRPTCRARERWYDLGKKKPYKILFSMTMGNRFSVLFNKWRFYCDHRLHEIEPKGEEEFYCAYLNSTVAKLFHEMEGYLLTGAINVVDLDTWSVNSFKVIKSSVVKEEVKEKLRQSFERLSQREIQHVLRELGADTPEEVSLEKVKEDRRRLDRIVMGEILGLSEEEQLEVYRAVVDLVRSRLEKARSVERRVRRGDVAVEEIAADVLREFGGELRFPEGYIEGEECEEIYIPKEEGEPSLESSL
ncbi:MAG: SAM-dependent DNA methyltransferase, partial [Methanophagales archaeon]|nr:SAM-dependent DNA methyltransferase [Methanophagales archaeon]